MRKTRAVASAACFVVLLTSACGSDDNSAASETEQATTVEDADATTTTAEQATSSEVDETTTTVEETTVSEVEEATTETSFPETPVATLLNQAYLFGSEQGPASADQLPFPVNTVTAHWYQSDGFYVVVYGALAPEQTLCPGNSIQTASGFEFVSNAPLGGADCSFAPVVAEAPNGVVSCNRVVSYVTLIPAGTEGNLFGTIEMMTDGLGVGLTSQVLADPANMPEIDRSLIDC
jgi:hypothetical protein